MLQLDGFTLTRLAHHRGRCNVSWQWPATGEFVGAREPQLRKPWHDGEAPP